MADSNVFEWVSAELAAATSLNELEARGTVRLALKQAGLEARTVDAVQMAVVLRQVLPGELAGRGIADGEAVCSGMVARIPRDGAADAGGESPEQVFQRLAGSQG